MSITRTLTIDASALQDGIAINGNDPTPSRTGTGIRIFNITDSSGGSAPSLTTLIGLTLTGADAQFDGGAIRSESRLAVRDCTIVENAADRGGGIYIQVAGGGATAREILRIENSNIDDNTASTGGGVAIVAGYYVDENSSHYVSDTVVINNTTFRQNTATNSGGGVYAQLFGGKMDIGNSNFVELNEAGRGGGLYFEVDGNGAQNRLGNINIVNATFATNTANGIWFVGPDQQGVGGAIGGRIFRQASVSIVNSLISGNSAFHGGGVSVDFGRPINTELTGFHSQSPNASLTISRSVVKDNVAKSRGGGIFAEIGAGGQATIELSTITGNRAGMLEAHGDYTWLNHDTGGGIHAYLFSGDLGIPNTQVRYTPTVQDGVAKLTIRDSTIDDNQARLKGGGVFLYAKREDNESTVFSQVGIANTTISGNSAGRADDPETEFENEAIEGLGGGIAVSHFQYDSFPTAVEHLDTRLTNVTITENIATKGGGIHSRKTVFPVSTNDTRLNNSIVSGNSVYSDNASDGRNLYGSFNVGESYNNLLGDDVIDPIDEQQPIDPHELVFDPAGNNAAYFSRALGNIENLTNIPLLGELELTGGLTKTHRPLAGSPAIDAGSNARAKIPFTNTDLATDQRGLGFARQLDVTGVGDPGNIVDIGAHEVGLAKIADVRLRGSSWSAGVVYSFAELTAAGKQLDSIFTQGVNTVEVVFTEAVQLSQLTTANVKLIGSDGSNLLAGSPTYNPAVSSVATWSLGSALAADKYRFQVADAVTDLYGRKLDADWDSAVQDSHVLASKDAVGRDWNNDQPKPFQPGGNVESGSFRLHFAYLPGDYNQDGRVVAGETGGDGNGNGFVNDTGLNSDATVVTNAITSGMTSLVAGRFQGDYSDNEIVDSASDYYVWKSTFGSTIDLRADGNGNGSIEAGDYSVWRDNLGGYSAWSKLSGAPGGGSGGGSGTPVFDPLNFPRVANVVVSASNQGHPPYHFDLHDGSGEQLRTVPVGAADTISIAFTEDVNITADTLRLTGMRTANRPTLAAFSYDLATMTATWRFTGWTFGDHYVIALDDAVTDVEGNRLDGEWTNPISITTTNAGVSEFPSGNGYAGGDFNFVVTLLPGDANVDLVVNYTDMGIHWSNMNINEVALFFDADFNGDNDVNSADLTIWMQNNGANLQSLTLLADLNGDWKVDDNDLNVLGANLGLSNPTAAQGDLDHDNDVDVHDLDRMFAQYGLELSVVA